MTMAGEGGIRPIVEPTNARLRQYMQESKVILDRAMEAELRRILGGSGAGNGAFIEGLNNGKKIRGCLTCLIGEILGASPDRIIPRAVAVEMIQTATLIHDDYVDQDRVRRNSPAVWTLEGSRRAVLIGDVVFASAIKMMSDLSREDGSAVSRAIALVSKGALHEPLDPLGLARLIEKTKLDGRFYDEIIRLKTGVLFGTACELGALAAGAREEIRQAFYTYGVRTGEAYQIADDLKEVEAHLLSRLIGQDQMIALAPALLRFAPDMCSQILDILNGGQTSVTEEIAGYMASAKEAMESAIALLLKSAVTEIEGSLPSHDAAELVYGAPSGIIGMFNES
jgi:geranylgeranyl pyrophosphate synthase